METLAHYGSQLAHTMLTQIIVVFGVFFIIGLLLYISSWLTRRVFVHAGFPKIDLFITAWIGTPIHELGHALFCILFGHTIKDIQLYKYDKSQGTLGYVTHSYDKRNIYHVIGNFFIGCGPILLGTAVLIALLMFILPNSEIVYSFLVDISNSYAHSDSLVLNMKQLLVLSWKALWLILSWDQINTWQFWLFLYVSISVSSHMQLSPPDIKTMLHGFLYICILMLVISLIAVVWEFDINSFILSTFSFGFIYAVAMLALFISVLNFIVTYLLFLLIHAVRGKGMLKL